MSAIAHHDFIAGLWLLCEGCLVMGTGGLGLLCLRTRGRGASRVALGVLSGITVAGVGLAVAASLLAM